MWVADTSGIVPAATRMANFSELSLGSTTPSYSTFAPGKAFSKSATRCSRALRTGSCRGWSSTHRGPAAGRPAGAEPVSGARDWPPDVPWLAVPQAVAAAPARISADCIARRREGRPAAGLRFSTVPHSLHLTLRPAAPATAQPSGLHKL